MERQSVRRAVLFNKYRSAEAGKGGGFCLVCCRMLSSHHDGYFSLAAVFGSRHTNPGDWIKSRGVAILWRRESPGGDTRTR